MAKRWEIRPERYYSRPSPTGILVEAIEGSKNTAWCMRYTSQSSSLALAEFSGSYGGNCHMATPRIQISVGKNVPLLLDCAFWFAAPHAWDKPPDYEEQHRNDGSSPFAGDIRYFCINRHNGGINSLFGDCSVRKVGLKELWTLKWRPIFDTDGPWTRAGGVQPDDWPEWMRKFKDY
jgi:prepilin-type processing-associated H-X9-DG protein